MSQYRLKHVLGAMIWLSIALAIYADYRLLDIAVEAEREWMRREYQTDNVVFYMYPRISPVLILPLIVAACFTMFGKYRVGLAFGLPAIITASWMLWSA